MKVTSSRIGSISLGASASHSANKCSAIVKCERLLTGKGGIVVGMRASIEVSPGNFERFAIGGTHMANALDVFHRAAIVDEGAQKATEAALDFLARVIEQ